MRSRYLSVPFTSVGSSFSFSQTRGGAPWVKRQIELKIKGCLLGAGEAYRQQVLLNHSKTHTSRPYSLYLLLKSFIDVKAEPILPKGESIPLERDAEPNATSQRAEW